MDSLEHKTPSASDETGQKTEIDIDVIMRSIREENTGTAIASVPDGEDLTCPPEPADHNEPPLFYFLLREMNQPSVPRMRIEPDVRPSRLDNLPFFGAFWRTLRYQLHGLSIFYVNKIIGQMPAYHRQMVTLLNIIVRQNQRRDAELAQLRQKVAELEAKLANAGEKR